MSDAPTNPNDPRSRVNKEYEDPHYHNEELDPDSDERQRDHYRFIKKPQSRSVPPPRRRYFED